MSKESKVSPAFKESIKAHLDKRAKECELFAKSYAKESKNIDDCCTYILNVVKKNNWEGLPDEEVFSMAIHYYCEDNIEIGNPLYDCRIVVDHVVELTEEEKKEARATAMAQYENNIRKEIEAKARGKRDNNKRVPEPTGAPLQLTLF